MRKARRKREIYIYFSDTLRIVFRDFKRSGILKISRKKCEMSFYKMIREHCLPRWISIAEREARRENCNG